MTSDTSISGWKSVIIASSKMTPRPRDARQVDTTWRFVNKNGGPDRRFKDNRQLPVMLYGESPSRVSHGLSWNLDLSVIDVADLLVSCLNGHPT